jgi:hypothetical protein
MTSIEKIKVEITALPEAEIAALRAWLDELAEAKFDEAIERDAKAGRLDALMAEAEANYKAGRRRPL